MAANIYRVLGPLQVETKTNWADPWVVRPNIEPLNGSAACEAVGQFQFRVRYGMLKHPSETVLSWHDYTQINRDWVRVKAAPYTDADILFMGRVESDSRELHGPVNGVSGVQTFTAYDGVQLLSKRIISESVVEETETDYKKHEILLHVNKPNFGRSFIGNRSLTLRNSGGIPHYVYLTNDGLGTPKDWTVSDFIRYLIAEFVGGSGNPAIDPLWQVTIPAGSLGDDIEPIDLPESASVIDLMKIVLGRHYGWTWCVLPTANGYNLRFSTVSATGESYFGATVPPNADILNVDTSDPNAQIHLERSQVQSHGRVRVLGKPMVVCATFDTREVHGAFDEANVEVETTYASNSGSGSDGGSSAVERRLKLRRQPFDLNGQHIPTVKRDGTLDTSQLGPIPAALNTLESLPLEAGHDYVYLPPPKYISESDLTTPFIASTHKDNGVHHELYHQSTAASLYTLPTRIGLGVKDFDETDFDFDDYDHSITVAFEAAQRLQCIYEVPGAKASDGEFVVMIPDAELWWLAKNTITNVNTDGSIEQTGDGKELRNDRKILYRVMAGVVARYVTARSRASVHFKGLYPYQNSLGMILGTVADSTNANTIAAPITGVQWRFEGDFSTTVTTGFAV